MGNLLLFYWQTNFFTLFDFIHSHLSLLILSTLSSLILSYSLCLTFPLLLLPMLSLPTLSCFLHLSLSSLSLYLFIFTILSLSFCFLFILFLFFLFQFYSPFSFILTQPINLFTLFQQCTSLFISYSLSLIFLSLYI